MQRKDYELIASAIRDEVSTYEGVAYGAAKIRALKYLCHRLATSMAEQNPRFNEQRFMTAAGFREED